jgi:tetratricopeptide (TPR) repeat protein
MNLDRKNYEATIRDFRDFVHNPDRWKSWQRLGFAYLKTNQPEKAIAEFKRVLGTRPEEPFSTYYLGLSYLELGDRKSTIETWQTYRNSREPLIEQEIRRQVTLIEMVECMHLARQALQEEQRLMSLPPREGSAAVLYFKDVSPDKRFQHLDEAMTAMIITDLSQVQALQVLERLRVHFLLMEMNLGQTGIIESGTAPKAGRLLGAENLIVGTIEPGSLTIKSSVASTSKQDLVGASLVFGELDQFYVLEKEVVYSILKVLKVPFTQEEEARFSRCHTQNLKAVVYFGQGLEALGGGEWKKARGFFRSAVKEDPSFELARQYEEACPGAGAPGLAALASMSAQALAASVEGSVADAMGAQAASSAQGATEGAGPGGGKAPAPATGSISVSW